MNAPQRLADELHRRAESSADQFFTQAVVQPGATDTSVLVDVAGAAVRCPYLQSYTPRAGDVVWLAGPPGSWVCLGTITAGPDMTIRNLTVTGDARIIGNTNVDGYIAKTNGFVMAQSPQGNPNLYSPAADVSLVGANGQLYSANPANNQTRNMIAANIASERVLKVEQEPVTDGLEVVEQLAPARWRWADPDTAGGDDGVHVGVYVDELAEADPHAVREIADGIRTYEDRALIAHLVSAVQTLSARNRELAQRVAALEDQPTGSTRSDDQPE